MSDNDVDRLATWTFKVVIYLLFGVFILAILLFQRYPKMMLSLLTVAGLMWVGSTLLQGAFR